VSSRPPAREPGPARATRRSGGLALGGPAVYPDAREVGLAEDHRPPGAHRGHPPEEVAATLRAAGVRGLRDSTSFLDPLVRYLNRTLDIGAGWR